MPRFRSATVTFRALVSEPSANTEIQLFHETVWRNGWAAIVTFDGQFSDTTRSYAGKGVVRYTW